MIDLILVFVDGVVGSKVNTVYYQYSLVEDHCPKMLLVAHLLVYAVQVRNVVYYYPRFGVYIFLIAKDVVLKHSYYFLR